MKDPAKRGVNYFYAHIKKLSYPYSKRIENDDNFEDFLEFQNFLDVYDTKDTEVFYNTRSRMIEVQLWVLIINYYYFCLSSYRPKIGN